MTGHEGTARRVGKMLAFATGLALVASALTYAGVSSQFDESVDFTRFRSYAWKEGTPAAHRDAERRIVDAIERELKARGLREVETDADLFVMSHVLVDAHTLEELSDDAQWLFWTGVGSVDARSVGAGTLVVDLVDGESQRIVWRGLATETLSKEPNRNLKKIDRIVKKLFKRLPVTGA